MRTPGKARRSLRHRVEQVGKTPHSVGKSAPLSEARKIVMCSESNGYEAWRRLTIRYQPPSGIRRMRQLAELTQLQNKRCKNVAQTSLIVLEIDREKILLAEAEGSPPSDDLLMSVLGMAMDPGTRSHLSGEIDVEEANYPLLRKTVAGHTNLTSATSQGRGGGPTAMDIGAIASFTDTEPSGAAPQGDVAQGESWTGPVDKAGWPLDE